MLRLITVLLLSVLSSIAYAQIMFVDDGLRVGVRPEASSASAPVTVIVTGDKVEVLEATSGYYRILTPSGHEGWVKKRYMSDVMPAKLRITAVEAENKALKQKLDVMVDEAKQLNVQLSEAASALPAEECINVLLNKPLTMGDDHTWLYWFSGILAVGPLGFLLGLLWYRHQIMKKLGGLTL